VLFLFGAPLQAQTIDHTSIGQFAQLTDAQITAARALRVSFLDRSVGGNTLTGLQTLGQGDPRFLPSNIEFRGWPKVMPPPNPDCFIGNGGWNGLWTGYGKCATQHWDAHPSDYDVVTWWFDYLSGTWASNPLVKYFTPTTNAYTFDASDYLVWRAAHPGLKGFGWTTSLPYTDGSSPGLLLRLAAFNTQMRAWSATNGQPLLDAADILSHAPDGTDCRDAAGTPRICQAYAADWQQGGGHLTPLGQERMAKAFWLMLSKL
jgi:hypothetical protein